ncbi:hypothetical protein T459_19250 [Capsicum annuum]|uniref:Uncharacterized protein n=1 Tax=Capsicum annuum TaxID=4072 RepID=A0A2G2Z168_CAPAN|nr:hypothetical protein T459_19250 [Capsicum annuum]
MSGPFLTGLTAIGSALSGHSPYGSWAAMIGIVGGTLASVVNSIEHGGQAWAFEAIPYLRQQVNYQEGVSCPRILRWLSAKTDKNAKFLDLFNPPKDAGGLVVVDGLSGDGAVGGGSGAAIGANDAPLTVFKANHYEYDHTGYTNFASPSECSACKCQDCRAKHDIVINAINALTASVKELTSKRSLIPSKRILFPSTPLEIRAKS